MAKATTTINFSDGDQVTSTTLDQIIGGFSLGSDSVDASTITVSSGVLSVGVLGAANLGADSVTTNSILDANVTGPKIANDSIDSQHYVDGSIDEAHYADGSVSWTKTKSADRAVQADMQSETASHFVSPDQMKYHPGIPKAYGSVSIVSGTTTVTGGYNITSATDTGTGRQITMSVTMANTNYIVVASYKDTGAVANSVGVNNDSTTQFTIQAGAESAGRAINFVVYGTLA